MHICFVVNTYEGQLSSPNQLLDVIHTLTGWTEALRQADCRVSVFQRFHTSTAIQRNGVDYFFFADAYGPQLRPWQSNKAMLQKVVDTKPDIVHLHNFNKVLPIQQLRRLLPAKVPILIQNHGETPRYWLREQWQRRLFRQIDGFVFTAKGQEKAWLEKSLLSKEQLYYVMEGSTHFQWKARSEARGITQMQGQPIFLWVANLNLNKDPFTILQAFERILGPYPNARLYMIYRLDDMLQAVQAQIEKSPLLSHSVHLLGAKPYEELPDYYNSADYFLLGSHYEGSGYALMESMACGVIPIVTDIPSFRMMTDEGQLTRLWPPEDVDALEQAILNSLRLALDQQMQKVRQFFESTLSYQAIVKRMLPIYQSLIAKKK